jgi:uncharacterized protein YbjT (DUF2867 family)
MRVLVLGAGGFIGRQILSELIAHDHEVVATVRRIDEIAEAFPAARFIEINLAEALRPADWTHALDEVDVIVNAAGILQGKTMEAIHCGMPSALHAAAHDCGVKRTVLISAISAREDVATEYARSKLLGERVARQSGLAWTILRPSLVYSDGSYGGTSLMRGLAALPRIIPVAGDGRFLFSPIHGHDLARAVRLACEDPRFTGQILEPAGPETLTLAELLTHYRRWLGFGRGRVVNVPMPFMRLLARIGDVARMGPMTSTSLNQLIAGNEGDGAAFARMIGFQPRSLQAALDARPAQVQDRWHARLFFLAPAVRATLVLLWVASALLGGWYGGAEAAHFVDALHLPPELAVPLQKGSSLLDLAVAALVLFDQRGRRATIAQLSVILGYTAALGIALPTLWFDPLGPLIKNLPILMLVLVHRVIADQR